MERKNGTKNGNQTSLCQIVTRPHPGWWTPMFSKCPGIVQQQLLFGEREIQQRQRPSTFTHILHPSLTLLLITFTSISLYTCIYYSLATGPGSPLFLSILSTLHTFCFIRNQFLIPHLLSPQPIPTPIPPLNLIFHLLL